MGEEPAKAEPERYRAFISYSHGDARFAHWLHRKLESWRLPDKSRLTPVFIDRAELAAGSDLSAQVREALEQSAALVVVCSPNARASRWVGQEIALFQTLHPDRPVLAALIEGEPGAAFPDPLLGTGEAPLEPLAADFRKGHDGQRLGLLKLVAGLTALPLDRLVQRDAAARQRRVMAITAAALALVLVLSAALVIALRARAEAERQRAEAEGLVEFMLTDLREKLKSTGDPKIMAAVNQQALDYYSRMDVTSLPNDSLERRARVLHAMGEDNERLGNFPAAQKMYLEAWRITDEVLKRHPVRAEAIFAHAQSEFWAGAAAWQMGDLKITENHWRAYLNLAERLSKIEPGTKRTLMELGYANGNMCELIDRSRQNLAEAIAFCDKSTGSMKKALEQDRDDSEVTLAMANRIGWKADLLRRHRHYSESLLLRKQEDSIVQRLLTSEPGNLHYRERVVWPKVGIAQTLLESGRPQEAEVVIKRCIEELEALQIAVPESVQITKQQMQAVWLAARVAKMQKAPNLEALLRRMASLHRKLKSALPANQMSRFDRMLDLP